MLLKHRTSLTVKIPDVTIPTTKGGFKKHYLTVN